MKVIRPQTPPRNKVEEKKYVEVKTANDNIGKTQEQYLPFVRTQKQLIDEHTNLCQEFGLFDDKTLPANVETLMSETQAEIDTNQIKVEFTLTKRQYDLWVKKGEVRWLKKALVGIKVKKKKLK